MHWVCANTAGETFQSNIIPRNAICWFRAIAASSISGMYMGGGRFGYWWLSAPVEGEATRGGCLGRRGPWAPRQLCGEGLQQRAGHLILSHCPPSQGCYAILSGFDHAASAIWWSVAYCNRPTLISNYSFGPYYTINRCCAKLHEG